MIETRDLYITLNRNGEDPRILFLNNHLNQFGIDLFIHAVNRHECNVNDFSWLELKKYSSKNNIDLTTIKKIDIKEILLRMLFYINF